MIAAPLAEVLPADDEMRTFYVVYTAHLAIAPLVKNSGTMIDVVAAQLQAAQTAGYAPVTGPGYGGLQPDRTLPRKRLLPIVELWRWCGRTLTPSCNEDTEGVTGEVSEDVQRLVGIVSPVKQEFRA